MEIWRNMLVVGQRKPLGAGPVRFVRHTKILADGRRFEKAVRVKP